MLWNRKWVLVPVLALAVGVGTVFGAASHNGNEVYAVDNSAIVQKSTITVAGTGKLQVTPDVAYVNVSVETHATTAKDAQAQNATQFAGLKKVLFTTYKMAEKDVKTTGFYVQPEYSYDQKTGESKVKGYVATHSVQITTRNLDGIGQLLDALSASGVNRVEGVQFDTEKQDQYELQALDKAMANARAKADTLAKAAGKQVKEVISISQNSVNAGPIYYGQGNMAAADSAMSGSKAPTSIETGTINVSTDITVVYEMQ